MASEMYGESVRAFLKPVLHYLDDQTVSEIMINAPDDVWIERGGKLYKTRTSFTPEGLDAAARNIAQYVGRVLSEERPRLDARLPDGSRIHVVISPIARKGTTIAIRKFYPGRLTIGQLVGFGSLTPEWARFIDACVQTKQNMMVAGGTASGKTTLLNVLSSFIPNYERILTIEDSAELQLLQDHLLSFESRPPDKQGKGAVTVGDLLHSALRLRPDRIIIGEVRGGEAFDLVQSMNTGHAGSMCTVHANSPTETCRRIESLCLMSEVELPMVAIRAQIAAAINIIICCGRFQDGSRRLTHISEVLPLNERGDYRTQDLFIYTVTGKDKSGRIHGYFAPTGILPTFLHKLRSHGFTEMDESFFDPATYGQPRPPVVAISEFRVRWVERLKDGVEQWEPRTLEPEKRASLDQAISKVFEDRDLEPPPFAEEEPADRAGGGESLGGEARPEVAVPGWDRDRVARREEPKGGESTSGQTSHRTVAGAYARQLLRKSNSGADQRGASPPIGVRKGPRSGSGRPEDKE